MKRFSVIQYPVLLPQVIAQKAIRRIYIDGRSLGPALSFDIAYLLENSPQLGKIDALRIVLSQPINVSENFIYITMADDKSDIVLQEKKKYVGLKLKKYSSTELKEQANKIMYEVFIKFENIIRITSSEKRNNLLFITTTGQYEQRITMKEILTKLPNQFIQIEKRDIINIDYLQGINPNKTIVFMQNKETLETVNVGRNFKEALNNKLENGLFMDLKN
ncbi:MAG: hypothetical protein ACI94Y_003595 [Maribacter sp.]|jgi:hypothetical protein